MEGIDKLVVAILAATKAAAEKKELPGQYVAEYQRMLQAYERRVSVPRATGVESEPSNSVTRG